MTEAFVSDVLDKEMEQIKKFGDLCKKWTETWRCVAVAMESLLRRIWPVAAKLVGVAIKVIDYICDEKNSDKPIRAVREVAL